MNGRRSTRHVQSERGALNGGSARDMSGDVKGQQGAPSASAVGSTGEKVLTGSIAGVAVDTFVQGVVFGGCDLHLCLGDGLSGQQTCQSKDPKHTCRLSAYGYSLLPWYQLAN